MKKQHLRKLERDTESQTEIERGERQQGDEGHFFGAIRLSHLAPEPRWQCSSAGGEGSRRGRQEGRDRRGKEGGVAEQLMAD